MMIFSQQMCVRKKRKKQVKKQTYLLFHLRPAGLPSESEGEDSESTTHTDAHTRGTVGEAEGDIGEEVYTPE